MRLLLLQKVVVVVQQGWSNHVLHQLRLNQKFFFANERTFLAWMHISIILAGASVAILALSDYDNIGKQLYGLIMLPVAIAFLVYSMFQCKY
jgi:uncharacterized membrane protein YidH (DUF202 family)